MERFAQIKDPRRPGSVRHKLTVLMVFGMLLFVYQCASRREANRELSRPGILEVLRSVFPEIDSIPHMDTLERLLEEIPADNIEDVLGKKIARLLRSKKLQALLVDKHYVVAIDGTQKFTRTVPFADEALHRQKGDKTTYVVYVLEAALVGPQGISIPILAEFCENKAEDENQEMNEKQAKQDCELKAFYRLRPGRHRWGIEENFLTEKNHGYNYEHAFSYNWNALKGWHALMRLAHLLNILTLHTVALWDTVQTLGMRGTMRFLWETLAGNWLDLSRLRALRNKPAQLRLVI